MVLASFQMLKEFKWFTPRAFRLKLTPDYLTQIGKLWATFDRSWEDCIRTQETWEKLGLSWSDHQYNTAAHSWFSHLLCSLFDVRTFPIWRVVASRLWDLQHTSQLWTGCVVPSRVQRLSKLSDTSYVFRNSVTRATSEFLQDAQASYSIIK